ncbi:LOW QUALITY PROTEIN: uncharacterized protein DPP9-AS1, partial [Pteropus vampyrus]|uniref:LOW QUALITY PROTEIN: uncharacterized protein DPP9-AS1 n=1 Tax=Pteropus vampyrus TaxID=132908 RepID=A0A6P6BYA6_PTEVA
AWVEQREREETHTRVSSQEPVLGRLSGTSPGGYQERACARGPAGRGPRTVCAPWTVRCRGRAGELNGCVQAGSAPPWAHCLPASSSSSPPRGARTVPPAGGPLPRRSSHHAPPLPIRGRGPGLSLPQRAAGGVLCSRTPSWGQQWRAMRRGARPRGAAAGRNSHVARPLPRCLP